MRNISVGQVIVLIIIGFFIFGDLNNLKKKIKFYISEATKLFKKQEKKDLNP